LSQRLRIYEIFEHNKSAFHARFRDHAARIMRRYGFDIVAMWEARTGQQTEFVYLVTRGRLVMGDWVASLVAHDDNHLAQLARALA
jgi:hypothetical protein